MEEVPNKTPLPLSESNIKNSILKGIVKRVINDNEGNKNNKVSYSYNTKLLKEYENIPPSINQKTIE